MPGNLIDRAKLEAAYIGFSTVFNNALKEARTYYQLLAMVLQSSNPVEQYNWMGTVPKLKEWLGDRSLAKLRAYNYQIVNRKWANGIEVDADDIKDDRLGIVAPRISALAEAGVKHYDELIFELLVNGFTQTAYDGQFFFDTDHKDGDGPTQSNKTTAVLAQTAYENAFRDLMLLKDENSEPIDVMPTHLVVGPKNRALARTILQADRNANGSTNTNFGTAELVVAPRISGAHENKWFLLALGGSVKPFVLQVREAIQFRSQDAPDDESSFMRDVYRYGANGRHNAGYGLWQFAYGSDGTV